MNVSTLGGMMDKIIIDKGTSIPKKKITQTGSQESQHGRWSDLDQQILVNRSRDDPMWWDTKFS